MHMYILVNIQTCPTEVAHSLRGVYKAAASHQMKVLQNEWHAFLHLIQISIIPQSASRRLQYVHEHLRN